MRDRLPLFVVALALVALAVVPYLGQEERQRLRERIEITESARHLADEMGTALARQWSSMQTFLLTRDDRFLQVYREARAQHGTLSAELVALTRQLDPPLNARLAHLAELVTRWEAPKDALVQGAVPPETLLARLPEQQRLYEEIVRAEADLDHFLVTAVTAARQGIREAERRNMTWIVLLSAIALAGALATALIGYRLFRLRGDAAEQAARAQSLNRQLTAQVEETQRLNAELQLLNEELVALTVAADAARDAAEHANRAKSDFLAVMSHELRTPLNAIAGYVELMEMGLHGAVTDAQARALRRVKRNQEHLLRLINDILQFATLQAGKIEVRTADVSAAEVLENVEAMTQPQVESRGLVYVGVPPQTEARVRGDPERINQILINLVGNAIKFTPAGGEVVVRCEVGEESVAFRVSDTGRGIPAHRLQSVFEPFVQVRSDAADDPSRQGVGLGLAISRELARAMGGDLAAHSVEGEGSTFTLTLLRGRRETTSITLHAEEAAPKPPPG